jgi:hypothetical protein
VGEVEEEVMGHLWEEEEVVIFHQHEEEGEEEEVAEEGIIIFKLCSIKQHEIYSP